MRLIRLIEMRVEKSKFKMSFGRANSDEFTKPKGFR